MQSSSDIKKLFIEKNGYKDYLIRTANVINFDLLDEYLKKVEPWRNQLHGMAFAKETHLQGKESTDHCGPTYHL